MLLDKQNEFSDSQAVTTTAISTNVIDTLPGIGGATQSNLGGVDSAFLVIQVDTTFTGLTSLTVTLESSSTANLATSPTVHAASAALLPADLVAGKTVIQMPLPAGDYKRYLGLRYTVAGTATAGAISAFITRHPNAWKAQKAAARPD